MKANSKRRAEKEFKMYLDASSKQRLDKNGSVKKKKLLWESLTRNK